MLIWNVVSGSFRLLAIKKDTFSVPCVKFIGKLTYPHFDGDDVSYDVTFQIIFKDVQFLEKQTATLEIVNIGQVGNLFESSRFVPQQTSLLWP